MAEIPLKKISRRDILKLSGPLVGGALLAGCAPAATATQAPATERPAEPTAAPVTEAPVTEAPVAKPVSGHVVVMHHGVKIADGPPEVIRKDAQVIDAYLGAEHAAA